MDPLRKRVIRVAHENPGEVREALLPLLKEGGGRPVAVGMKPKKRAAAVAEDLGLKGPHGAGRPAAMLKQLVRTLMSQKGTHPGAVGLGGIFERARDNEQSARASH